MKKFMKAVIWAVLCILVWGYVREHLEQIFTGLFIVGFVTEVIRGIFKQ